MNVDRSLFFMLVVCVIILCLLPTGLSAQQLHFENKKHNFGYLQRGQIDTIYFPFVNKGKLPLLINDAKFECSCTHVDFPKDSIAPGQTGEIIVIYDSKGAIGLQDRAVTIISNSRKGNEKIHFRGEVLQNKKMGF
jgi:hypothetical protein